MGTGYFVTIVHNPNKISSNLYLIISIDVDITNSTNKYLFCCFYFEFETSYYSWCYKDYFLINRVFQGLKKSSTFWLVSVLKLVRVLVAECHAM